MPHAGEIDENSFNLGSFQLIGVCQSDSKMGLCLARQATLFERVGYRGITLVQPRSGAVSR